jgi:hypothetical protein
MVANASRPLEMNFGAGRFVKQVEQMYSGFFFEEGAGAARPQRIVNYRAGLPAALGREQNV